MTTFHVSGESTINHVIYFLIRTHTTVVEHMRMCVWGCIYAHEYFLHLSTRKGGASIADSLLSLVSYHFGKFFAQMLCQNAIWSHIWSKIMVGHVSNTRPSGNDIRYAKFGSRPITLCLRLLFSQICWGRHHELGDAPQYEEADGISLDKLMCIFEGRHALI